MENDVDFSSQNEENMVKVSLEEAVEHLHGEFAKPFFENNDDLKAAAGIGFYFNMVSYLQERELGNRSLVKNIRTWMKNMNKDALLQIFAECNKVLFAIANKNKTGDVSLGIIRRKLIEPYILKEPWKNSSEKLSLAFMIGYDAYLSAHNKKKEDIGV